PLARRLRARLAGPILRDGALDVDIHGEFVEALVRRLDRLDLDQTGVLEVRGGLEVAHQGRYTRLRLRETRDRDLLPALAHRLEINSVRELAHQLVHEMYHLGAVRLQRF